VLTFGCVNVVLIWCLTPVLIHQMDLYRHERLLRMSCTIFTKTGGLSDPSKKELFLMNANTSLSRFVFKNIIFNLNCVGEGSRVG